MSANSPHMRRYFTTAMKSAAAPSPAHEPREKVASRHAPFTARMMPSRLAPQQRRLGEELAERQRRRQNQHAAQHVGVNRGGRGAARRLRIVADVAEDALTFRIVVEDFQVAEHIGACGCAGRT